MQNLLGIYWMDQLQCYLAFTVIIVDPIAVDL